jgi:hypothetical protein
MSAELKPITDFLVKLGIDNVPHTEKSYLGHLIAVHRDLKTWGCPEEVCRGGMFHSIYGTEMFQGFKLPLERRGELRELIGERAERLGYWNCAMDRPAFDANFLRPAGGPVGSPFRWRDRITGEVLELSRADFEDLTRIHLCDWLEQVPRSKKWDYRRPAYREMARWLGGVAQEAYDRVFAKELAGAR